MNLQPPFITAVFFNIKNGGDDMKVVLVDSAYFGDALSHARQNARINRRDAARMLGTTTKYIGKYESGKMLIPAQVLERIFQNGFMMLLARKYNKYRPIRDKSDE